jgi:hypothetical protein
MRQNCGKTVVNPTINLAFGKSLIPPIDGDLGMMVYFLGLPHYIYIYIYIIHIYDYMYVNDYIIYVCVNETATGWYVHYIEWYLEEIGFAG